MKHHQSIPTLPVSDVTDLTDVADMVRTALSEHPAFVLRDVVDSLDDFHALTDALAVMIPHQPARYSWGKLGTRDALDADGRTSTVNLGQEKIGLHRERAYTPMPPGVMFFYCVTPPQTPAPTTVLDGVQFLASLPDELRDYAERTKLRFRLDAELDEGRRTQLMNMVRVKRFDDIPTLIPAVAKSFLLEDTLIVDTITPDRMAYEVVSPLIRRRTLCGRPSLASYFTVGLVDVTIDGGPLPQGCPQFQALVRHAEAVQYEHTWQANDLLVLDNHAAMHGRLAHLDEERVIGLRMGWMKGMKRPS